MKVVDSKTALTLFFVFVVLPTPAFLSAAGLWHHNDIFWRMFAQIALDCFLFLFLRHSLWRRLPDAQQQGGQRDGQQPLLGQQ
ncbi:MAG TPA: hypothetical protein VK421_05410 [Pyrinomonadaceae bacterium]|nr:hypothetical protein [Pyrinomonadaceae bacterium]